MAKRSAFTIDIATAAVDGLFINTRANDGTKLSMTITAAGLDASLADITISGINDNSNAEPAPELKGVFGTIAPLTADGGLLEADFNWDYMHVFIDKGAATVGTITLHYSIK